MPFRMPLARGIVVFIAHRPLVVAVIDLSVMNRFQNCLLVPNVKKGPHYKYIFQHKFMLCSFQGELRIVKFELNFKLYVCLQEWIRLFENNQHKIIAHLMV